MHAGILAEADLHIEAADFAETLENLMLWAVFDVDLSI